MCFTVQNRFLVRIALVEFSAWRFCRDIRKKTETGTQIGRQTDRHTGRQTDRHTRTMEALGYP